MVNYLGLKLFLILMLATSLRGLCAAGGLSAGSQAHNLFLACLGYDVAEFVIDGTAYDLSILVRGHGGRAAFAIRRHSRCAYKYSILVSNCAGAIILFSCD